MLDKALNPITGCTEENAKNYNKKANIACEGCCRYEKESGQYVEGCMQKDATNYNPAATQPCQNCCESGNFWITSSIVGAWCYSASNKFEFYDNGKFYETTRRNIYSGFWYLSKKRNNNIILEYSDGDLSNFKIISQYEIESQNRIYKKCNN